MKKNIILLLINIMLTLSLYLLPIPTYAVTTRIKDIVYVEGVRDNILVGYGLVVGLSGTGDNLNSSVFTQKGLVDFLEKLGVNIKGMGNLKPKNVAAVTVTSILPPFARHGNRIDVSVSALGDAKSLQGGTLLATPLLGADGEVYAVSQGQVSLGGFVADATTPGGGRNTITKNTVTNGFIPNGAIVEKEVNFEFNSMSSIKLALKNPDISTATDIATTINQSMQSNIAKTLDPGTVELLIPNIYRQNVMGLLSQIEKLQIIPDYPAKILIDGSSGTIVMGENVRISPVAISQGNLVVVIQQKPDVSQPPPFAPPSAQTVVVTDTTIDVKQTGKGLAVLEEGSTLQEVVDGLNALGVGPRDLITILGNIKAAGALQASIETR